MIKLYIDFDGVILNTIDITYKIFEENNIDTSDKVKEFYRDLDWDHLLKISSPINDSINNIKKLMDSGLYDVSVLSHVVTDEEASAKEKYLNKYIQGIELIAVDREKNKCDVVDCRNAILVDDYMGNLNLWYDNGGIPVKFSDKGKKCEYMSVSNLGMLIGMYDEILNYIVGKVN